MFPPMKIANHAARIVLGLLFFVFGLNGFLQFLPMPPLAERPGAFMGALAATGYMFPLIKSIEVAAGAALLAKRFVPLALLALAPIVVNIAAFHLFLSFDGYPMVALMIGLGGFLAWQHRASFRPLFATAPVEAAAPMPARQVG